MDKSLFGNKSPGVLAQVTHPHKDWSFIPNPMPPSWSFPTYLWPLLAEAKQSLGTLNGIGQTLPNPEILLRPLQSREAIESSRIEGTYVTPEQQLLYELNPKEPSSPTSKVADWLEVFSYSAALKLGIEAMAEQPTITNVFIRQLHQRLMRGVRGSSKSPGKFRMCPVIIGSSGRFIPPPANEVDPLMTNLKEYINAEDQGIDPLVKCFLVHYQFETIHPFEDGNGRVGRLLLAMMICWELKHSMPWLYMSAYFEKYRDEYIECLFKISSEGQWSQWIEFCLRGTVEQANDSINRCHRFKELRIKLNGLVKSATPRSHKIIDLLFTSQMLTIPSLKKEFGISYATARSDIKRLEDSGILREIQEVRPRSFYCPELMKIAYGST